VTKNNFNIVRHYGNKDLKTIIGKLVSTKLSNFKFNREAYDNSYYNINADKIAIHQEASISE